MKFRSFDLNNDKTLISALLCVHGVNLQRASRIITRFGWDPTTRLQILNRSDFLLFEFYLDYYLDLNVQFTFTEEFTFKSYVDMKGCYKGLRFLNHLPLRGQRTHSNAKTFQKKKFSVH